jgi:hypothetical protein
MTFTRLRRGDVLALLAALALLLVMSIDWYTTKVGEQARQDEAAVIKRSGQISGHPSAREQERGFAESQEKNAWQASGAIDRVILIVLVAAAALAIVAAFLRAADRRVGPPSATALASVVGLVAAALLAYRILQPPGLNAGAVVKIGAPLGLLCVGLVTLGTRIATLQERTAPRVAAGGAPPVDDAASEAGRTGPTSDAPPPAAPAR